MQTVGLRTSLAGGVGNLLEWYDFAVFGYFAPFISSQFFPADNPVAGLINTFGVFAAGYLMRPVGGVLFGQIGDRLGRARALQLSIFVMAVPTTLIAVLPTYAQVGVLAPVLLVILRLAQGLSVGGEFIGSCCYFIEAAPAGRRGLLGSWSVFGTIGGMLLGSAVATLVHALLSPEQIHAWGWRVPFLGGLLVGVVSRLMRSGVQETPEFVRLQSARRIEERPGLARTRLSWPACSRPAAAARAVLWTRRSQQPRTRHPRRPPQCMMIPFLSLQARTSPRAPYGPKRHAAVSSRSRHSCRCRGQVPYRFTGCLGLDAPRGTW
jgi:MFS family permease